MQQMPLSGSAPFCCQLIGSSQSTGGAHNTNNHPSKVSITNSYWTCQNNEDNPYLQGANIHPNLLSKNLDSSNIKSGVVIDQSSNSSLKYIL
jgi:hypothetical protein